LFVGQYSHSLDYKSRISIPKKFRDELKNRAILTRGLDNCLFLYPMSEWEILSERLRQLPLTGRDARAFSRYLFSGAVEVKFDRLGRITVPDYLVKHAHFKKSVVIIGVLNRVEIWSKEFWDSFNKRVSKKSEEIAEKLSGSGI